MKKTRGRPPSQQKQRTVQAAFYLIDEDARYLSALAEACGFKSRSEMITAMMERLILGGFSVVSFAKLGVQFSSVMGKREVPTRADFDDLFAALRPNPPLIPDAPEPEEGEIISRLDELTEVNQKRKEAIC